jgi:hypothetical protein
MKNAGAFTKHLNLGIKTYLNGTPTSNIVIDTTAASSSGSWVARWRGRSWRAQGVFLFVVRRPPMKYHTSGIGETGEVSPMLLRWIDYDPVALVVLMVGIGAISLLALSM